MSRAWALLAVLALSCGDDDGGMADAGPSDAGAPVDAGADPTVTVTVESGATSFDGRVLVGAFTEESPMTPPVALERLDAPTFPATASLLDVPPGTYWVLGVLDFDPPSPTIPGPEDSTGVTGPIEVVDTDLEITVTLPVP